MINDHATLNIVIGKYNRKSVSTCMQIIYELQRTGTLTLSRPISDLFTVAIGHDYLPAGDKYSTFKCFIYVQFSSKS